MKTKTTAAQDNLKKILKEGDYIMLNHDDDNDGIYKFNEANTIEQIKRYVDMTYEKHYGYGKYQATDMIIDAGYGEAFCIGNIMKYAMRYGKKPNPVTGEYNNQGDLLKIIHYAIIAIHLWTEESINSGTN